MPITDYDFSKTLQATSFSDSASTVDKAQPVLLRGNDYTGVDGFESGSSQLEFESLSYATIDSNSEVYLNNSLRLDSSNADYVAIGSFDSNISSDGKRLTGSIKIDNQTGNSNDQVTLDGYTNQTVSRVAFKGDGNIEDGQGNTIGTWSANQIYDVELVHDFTNNQYDIVIDGSVEASNVAFNSSTSEITQLRIENDTSNSGGTVNAFFDRLTYTSPVEDSINAGGFIGYDSSTINGSTASEKAEDVAFYDQNDNLLDYELENGGDLGSSSAEVVAWVYRSYTRDDSDQVKFAFGNNSANEDRQNVTGTWNNTGQNAIMVQHLQDNPLTATDSTANNNDGTINGATAVSDGMFDGAASFDGIDDNINEIGSSNLVTNNDFTVVAWTDYQSSDSRQIIFEDFDSGSPFNGMRFLTEDSNELVGAQNAPRIRVNGDSGSVNIAGITGEADGEFDNIVGRWDESAGSLELYNNSNLIASGSGSVGDWSVTSSSSPHIGAAAEGGLNLEGVVDEVRLYSDYKSNAWIQSDYDASPKAGQVFFTQDAAQSTVTAREATATKYSASYSSQTPNVIVGKTATGTKYSANYSTLQADSISSATSTANKYSGIYSSQTASTSFSATIQATKYSATYSSQTATTTSIEVAPATKYTGTYTANTAKTALPITANATKYSANYSSQTATTVQILSAAANKYSASYNSRTAETVSIKTAPVTKYSANYSTRQGSTTFDATTNATKYSASYTAETAATLVNQMAEADKYNLTYSSKTATGKILVSGPDVTYPLFVNEESMRKRIKDQ